MASLYIVYFDESGTHDDSEAAVVAGFVSNETKWKAFSQSWQKVLADSGLGYFRMSEFENRRGQFAGWTENEKRTLLSKLLPIIHEHTFWSIGCIVLRQQFDELVSSEAKEICGDAYGFAALICWRNLGQLFQSEDAWMDCRMEAGAKGSGSLELLVEEDLKFPSWREAHRIHSLSFLDKREFPPLQAADILAYELYKQSSRIFGEEKRPVRYPLTNLSAIKHQWLYVLEKKLSDFNDDVTKQIADLQG